MRYKSRRIGTDATWLDGPRRARMIVADGPVDCSHVYGLFGARLTSLAKMKSADRLPIKIPRSEAP